MEACNTPVAALRRAIQTLGTPLAKERTQHRIWHSSQANYPPFGTLFADSVSDFRAVLSLLSAERKSLTLWR